MPAMNLYTSCTHVPSGACSTCAAKLELERDRYREVVELILRRNRLMNPLICLDMLEDQAHKALGL